MNAPLKPPDKFAEAKRFLLALNPSGPWALTAIRPFRALGARRTATLFCTSIDQAVASLTEHNGTLNIHLTANTTKPVLDKPRERDLERLLFVQVDIDKDEEGKRLAGASKRKFIERLRSSEFCEAASIPGAPTFIIDSGNGVQALWRIRGGLAPWGINRRSDEMNHDEIMERAKRLAAHHARRRLARPVEQPDPGDENFEEDTEPSDAG